MVPLTRRRVLYPRVQNFYHKCQKNISRKEFYHYEGKIKISENLWNKTWPQLIGKLAPISEKLAPICQKLAPIYYKMDPILERWPQVPKRWPQVHRRWPQVHKRWPLLLQNLDPIARRGLWRKYKNSKKWVKLADFFGFKYIYILTNICLFWPENIAKVSPFRCRGLKDWNLTAILDPHATCSCNSL